MPLFNYWFNERTQSACYVDSKDPVHHDGLEHFNGVRVRFVCLLGDEMMKLTAAILRLKKLLELDYDEGIDEHLQKTGESGETC